MIARSYIFQIYHLLVHVPDFMMDCDPFVTMFKYNRPHPRDVWTDNEKAIADRALVEGLRNPRKPEDPMGALILPN